MPVTAAYECVAAFTKQLAVVAGGCTVVSTDAIGYWFCDTHGLITDEQTIVNVTCTSSLWNYEVLPLVSQLKIDLNQRSIYVTSVNTDIIFIP